VRSKAKAKIQLGALVKADGSQLDKDRDIAENVNEYFSSVLPRKMIRMHLYQLICCSDVIFSEEDVAETLARICPDKVSGPDALLARLLLQIKDNKNCAVAGKCPYLLAGLSCIEM